MDLLVQILQWVPITKSKLLALLSLGKTWYAALTDPKVHCEGWGDMGPDAPRLQAAILALISHPRVQTKWSELLLVALPLLSCLCYCCCLFHSLLCYLCKTRLHPAAQPCTTLLDPSCMQVRFELASQMPAYFNSKEQPNRRRAWGVLQ